MSYIVILMSFRAIFPSIGYGLTRWHTITIKDRWGWLTEEIKWKWQKELEQFAVVFANEHRANRPYA
jgi:hypothetical protein